MNRAARTTLRQIWWAPLVCFGLAWGLSRTSLGQQQEWKTLDWRTAFRAIWQKPPDARLAVVLFEDDTDANLVAWPPDRAWHGNFNKFISVLKPKVVTWDVILDASREGEGDAQMAADTKAAIEQGTRVIVGVATSLDPVEVRPGPDGPTQPLTQIEGERGAISGEKYALVPFPELRAVALWGIVDAARASDGIIREVPMIVRYDDKFYPSLALQTLMAYFDVPAEQVRVKLGDAVYLPTKERLMRIPISSSGKFFVNYRYDQRENNDQDFPTYTYREVLLKVNSFYVDKNPHAPRPPNFEGKAVFVGQTVQGKADAGPTPRGAYSPLVLVHANIVNNVLADDFAWQVPDWSVWLTALVLSYAGIVVLADRSVLLLCGGAIFGLVSYVSLGLWSWVGMSWWFPLMGPSVGFAALQFIIIGRRIAQEQRQKQEIKNMFGSYVSPVLVERMVKADQPPHLGGHLEEITAYFSDIQSFSTFSEKLSPERLVELMNEYLTACTDIVQAEGGTLDKYIGDAVVVMFGAPIALPDHALRACVASQRVQLRIAELRDKWRSEGDKWPDIVWNMRTRIGLNSGRCVVGNMGSRTRFNYTMMGDDVNLAARMESGAKQWGAYSMCSEVTKAACEKHGGDRVVFRPLGRIVVKGRAVPTPIFEIVGLKENVTAQTFECLALFQRGLERYYERDWRGAADFFTRSEKLEPGLAPGSGAAAHPSGIYLGMIDALRTDPPGEGWDGVYVMKEK